MKKTNYFLTTAAILLSLLIMVFSSCDNSFFNSDDGKAYVTFTSNERTLFPTVATSNFSSLALTGSLSGSEATTLSKSWTSYTDMTKATVELEPGSWSFTLTATASGLTYTGTLTKEIVAGTTPLEFTLACSSFTATSGTTGTLSYTLAFPSSSSVAYVNAGLFDTSWNAVDNYQSESLTITTSGDSTDGATTASGTTTNSVTYSKTEVPSGNYYLTFTLYDINYLKLGGKSEMVYIADGLTSTKSITLDSVNEPNTITYNTNEGTVTKSFDASYSVYSDAITLPTSSEITKTDCKFDGWYTDEALTTSAGTTIAKGSSGNITLYAKWITVSSIAATLATDTVYLVGSTPASADFTATATYSDNSTGTLPSTSYTVSCSTNYVGTVQATITLTSNTAVTATTNFTYKYTSAAPVISTQPVAASIAAYTGSTTLSVTAKVTSYSFVENELTTADTVSYQWYKDAKKIENATNYYFDVSALSASAEYYCEITATPSNTSNSSSALTTTSNTISATSSSIAQYTGSTTLTANCTTGFTSYTVNSESTTITDTVSYQWYSATSSSDTSGTAIDSATSSTYTVSAQEAAGTIYYYCVATTTCGNSTYCSNSSASLTATSTVVEITVSPWLPKLVASDSTEVTISEDSTSLTAGSTYTLTLTNAALDSTDTTDAATITTVNSATTWASSDTTFTLTVATDKSSYTLKTPAVAIDAQTSTLTATATVGTFTHTDSFTVEVPKATTYKVTFESQSGSAVEAQTVISGNPATEPTAPTYSGYTFGGWYTESDCTTSYSFTTAVTADITLYAKWTAISTASITVTLDATSDITVTSSKSGTDVTLTADSGYSSYTWTVNNVAQDSTTNTLTFIATSTAGVTYDVLLTAEKNGITYSASIQVVTTSN